MKILFIVGVYPPKICGIGDYTYKLKTKLDEVDYQTYVIYNLNWKTNPFKIIKKINSIKPDVIHIQYPLTGLFAHILIFFCFLKYKIIVTAHEFAETHWSRKISMFIFPLVKYIIWTSEIELKNFEKYFPIAIPCKHCIVPIASNIPFLEAKPFYERERVIGFFGSIRPGKGIDHFFELVENLNNTVPQINFKFVIMGTVLDIYKNYFDKIKQQYDSYNIEWKLNFDEHAVAKELTKIKYVYLPFEDGASERRGSLLAAVGNGAYVISTPGKYVTSIIKSSVEFATSYMEAKKIILHAEESLIYKKNLELKNYYSWDSILLAHLKIYQELEYKCQNA